MTLCDICGRPGCRCGELHPERKCSTHACALVCEAIPVYRIEGGIEIKGWFYVLRCPFAGCTQTRALKAPTGARTDNRKTTRKNKK